MGEFVAWIIGWDLVLEYAVGAVDGRHRLERVLQQGPRVLRVDHPVPMVATRHSKPCRWPGTCTGIMNIPAVFILLLLSLLLDARHAGIGVGQQPHRRAEGRHRADGHHDRLGVHQPGQPHAAHSGGDALHDASRGSSTPMAASWGSSAPPASCSSPTSASTPCRRPRRRPRTRNVTCRSASSGRSSSAPSSTSCSRTSSAASRRSRTSGRTGREASVAFAITKYMTGYGWLANLVTVAILAGFSSVILVMLLGQSRVFYSMSQRRARAEGVFGRPSDVPHALQVQHAVLRVHGALRGVRARWTSSAR